MANEYVTLSALKATLNLSTESFADADIGVALEAASRGVDDVCHRRFWADPDANQVRYYNPFAQQILKIDDLVTLTTLATDPGGDGTFELTWTLNSDFTFGPQNADADGFPWEIVKVHPNGRYIFPKDMPRSVKVTAKFGWPAIPPKVISATGIIAHKLLRRAREAPFGIVSMIGADSGVAMRIARNDPDVMFLLDRYIKGTGPSGAGLA